MKPLGTFRVQIDMKTVALLGFAIAGIPAVASDVPQPVRFPIRHADPWFVKAMLEGQNPFAPEISTDRKSVV